MRRELRPAQEYCLDAIPTLAPGSFRLFGPRQWAIVGDAPKDFLIMGSADSIEGAGHAYIAKAPRKAGALECITEQVISTIGRMLPLKVAKSRLVLLPTLPGAAPDLRFMSRYFLQQGEEQLVHAVELVSEWLGADRREMEEAFLTTERAERSFYTIELVRSVLSEVPRWGEGPGLLAAFGRMMAFDALVGTNDRHALNWGVIRQVHSPATPLRFAPIYDTARGLFWQRREKDLERADFTGERESFVAKYARGSRPIIGCRHDDRGTTLNHFGVIAYMLEKYPGDFRAPIRRIVDAFDADRVRYVLVKEFGRIVTGRRIEFIDALLRYRHRELRHILDESRSRQP
ncbi:HipA domain-containing protein [Myxococcota bacterium]|nr:HipA domain-containing protein [Myxococcota bacterium]